MNKVKILLYLIISLIFIQTANADNVIPAPSTKRVKSQNVDFSQTYKTSSENLLYLLLSALNENNYSIEEIQFKTGCVLFKAYTKEFIASVAAQDNFNSFIKITPTDNNYNFSPLLLQRLQKYIEENNDINYKRIL